MLRLPSAAVVATEAPDDLLKPAILLQLTFQAGAFFCIMIPANAIIVARVSESELSSTVAVVQMQQRVTSVVSGAAMVSIIGINGDISDPAAYRALSLTKSG